MIGTTSTPPQRFLGASLLLLAACGGGGGSGGTGTATPVIVTASFSGSGAPTSGDTLLLAFSRDVTLVAGKLLTDADVTLSGGGDSLGSVASAPTLLSSNTISITLGVGVTFTPGTTTIVLSSDNDVVGGTTTAPTGGGTPVTIGTSDGTAPTLSNVTLAATDSAFNGTGAAGGTLQVPPNGWTIDLTYSDNSAISTSQTVITADVAVTTPSGSQLPGTDLRAFLTEDSASNTAATYTVPSGVTFPTGAFTLTCIVVDASGLSSTPATFSATVSAFTDALRPFETAVNASQVWFLDFSRDLESYTTAPLGSAYQVDVNSGSNSLSDFEDLLAVIGLRSSSPIANVSGSKDSNEVVLDQIQARLLLDLAAYYSGANVTFTLAQPSGSFGGNSSVAYASLGYSSIAIGGASTTSGVLGLAIFDPSNTTQNDNTQESFQSQRLGVFLHTIVDSGMRSPSSAAFRITFDPFTPDQGGTPIGDDASDDQRLLGLNTDARATQITTAITELARFVATVTAHECGHSVGLVENGAMPTGLFGNDTTNFPGSSDGHIRNLALFPAGSTNVMSPSLSYTTATSSFTAFNTLNLAYLREQVFYGN